ncbi:hypothetical protein JKP88DRAFT_221168 [Tribonema minus]|uniref:Uncharacterized protein n=1 Tax=Tribonema minus TaxID=303371 RepID=A0A836CFZ7_9STRA|nr:hypothetical protein JKP88DRAFT_221168 [Tribonema minus]
MYSVWDVRAVLEPAQRAPFAAAAAARTCETNGGGLFRTSQVMTSRSARDAPTPSVNPRPDHPSPALRRLHQASGPCQSALFTPMSMSSMPSSSCSRWWLFEGACSDDPAGGAAPICCCPYPEGPTGGSLPSAAAPPSPPLPPPPPPPPFVDSKRSTGGMENNCPMLSPSPPSDDSPAIISLSRLSPAASPPTPLPPPNAPPPPPPPKFHCPADCALAAEGAGAGADCGGMEKVAVPRPPPASARPPNMWSTCCCSGCGS